MESGTRCLYECRINNTREEVVAVLPHDSPLAQYERVPVSELAKAMKLIPISAEVAPAVHTASDEIEQRAGIKFQRGFCSENLMTSMNAVASGFGFCFFAAYRGRDRAKRSGNTSPRYGPASANGSFICVSK